LGQFERIGRQRSITEKPNDEMRDTIPGNGDKRESMSEKVPHTVA
jgi:hypothetical protein